MFKTTLLATMAVSSVNAVDLERRGAVDFFPGLNLLRQEGKKSGIEAATGFLNFWAGKNHGFRQSSAHLVDEDEQRPYDDFFFINDPKFGGFFGGRDNDLIPKFLFEDEEPKAFGLGRTRIQPKVKSDVVVTEGEPGEDGQPKIELKTILSVEVT